MKTSKLSKKKVKIRNREGRLETFWKVLSPRPGGGSNRRFFKVEAEANTHLELQKIQLTNFGTAGASMTEKLRGAALRAQEILEPLGLDLVEAAAHYAAHHKASTGGIPLSVAAKLLQLNREPPSYSPSYRAAFF